MPIYRMVGNKEDLETVPPTSFGEEGVLEQDLQKILRDQPDILEPGLFILAEEFSNWQGSGLSIDLLGLDTSGSLVVIELKRTESGELADLQAVRYAAMISNMTLEQAISAHQAYLDKRGIEGDAEGLIQEHLDNTNTGEIHTAKPRIVLASAGFSAALTTTVLWLNDNGLDITCIRMQPYRSGSELMVEASQVIPLPEAADYLVRIREREGEARQQRSGGGHFIEGGDAFRDSIPNALKGFQDDLDRLYQWAIELENAGLAELSTWPGPTTTLRVKVPGKSALVSIYNQTDAARIYFQSNNFRRIAPSSTPTISALIGANLDVIKQSTGRRLSAVSKELLDALTAAYREANGLVGDDGDGE